MSIMGLPADGAIGLGLREAMAACRAGDTLVVTKLDRLARSVPDARDIVEELTGRGVSLSIGGSVHDPSDPVGRLLFNVLAMVAEFEADLIRMRTREGMKVARAKGRLRGKQPKLTPQQEAVLGGLYEAGEHTSTRAHEQRAGGVVRRCALDGVPRAGAPPSPRHASRGCGSRGGGCRQEARSGRCRLIVW
jgi:DNA invertase Pin-like site-specific DNA recombinase